MSFLLVVVLADLAAAATAAPALPARNELPERVTIQVTGSDFGWTDSRTEIRRTAKGFSDGTRSTDQQLLRALVAAATAAAVPTIDALGARVDAAELRRAAEAKGAQLPPKTGARFVERLCDPKNRSRLLANLTNGEWDSPSIEVDLTLRGGEHVLLRSGKQLPFMLPWQITRGSRRDRSFDPEISRAVAKLVPGRFVDNDRMARFNLVEELVHGAEIVWSSEIRTETEQETYSAQVEPLRRRFQVSNELHYSQPESWNGVVRAANEPQVQFDLTLSIREARVASVEPFLRDADGLVRRVRAVPWIARFLAAHPSATLSITYHDARSISDAAEGRRFPSPSPVALAPLLDRVVAFRLDEGRQTASWLLLPDDRTLCEGGDLPPARAVLLLDREGQPAGR